MLTCELLQQGKAPRRRASVGTRIAFDSRPSPRANSQRVCPCPSSSRTSRLPRACPCSACGNGYDNKSEFARVMPYNVPPAPLSSLAPSPCYSHAQFVSMGRLHGALARAVLDADLQRRGGCLCVDQCNGRCGCGEDEGYEAHDGRVWEGRVCLSSDGRGRKKGSRRRGVALCRPMLHVRRNRSLGHFGGA